MVKDTVEDLSAGEVYLDLNNGEYLQFNMTLPLPMIFDDIFTFVSKTDFDN